MIIQQWNAATTRHSYTLTYQFLADPRRLTRPRVSVRTFTCRKWAWQSFARQWPMAEPPFLNLPLHTIYTCTESECALQVYIIYLHTSIRYLYLAYYRDRIVFVNNQFQWFSGFWGGQLIMKRKTAVDVHHILVRGGRGCREVNGLQRLQRGCEWVVQVSEVSEVLEVLEVVERL